MYFKAGARNTRMVFRFQTSWVGSSTSRPQTRVAPQCKPQATCSGRRQPDASGSRVRCAKSAEGSLSGCLDARVTKTRYTILRWSWCCFKPVYEADIQGLKSWKLHCHSTLIPHKCISGKAASKLERTATPKVLLFDYLHRALWSSVTSSLFQQRW